ncbi:hypothetical protein Hdeb2414_s1186g00990281 [Helianthus debilis subsp. tardiflorus]
MWVTAVIFAYNLLDFIFTLATSGVKISNTEIGEISPVSQNLIDGGDCRETSGLPAKMERFSGGNREKKKKGQL